MKSFALVILASLCATARADMVFEIHDSAGQPRTSGVVADSVFLTGNEAENLYKSLSAPERPVRKFSRETAQTENVANEKILVLDGRNTLECQFTFASREYVCLMRKE